MQSKQKNRITRFSRKKTFFTYFITWYYLFFSTFAYAGPGLFEDEIDQNSNIIVTRTSNNLQEEVIETTKTTPPPSYFSSFQNIANSTFDWIYESALSSCECFQNWIGSYGQGLPRVYFAKSFLELDYVHDELFWQGHFNEEINSIRQAHFLGSHELSQLKDLQDIVWNGLLSPYIYEAGLKELQKKNIFSRIRDIRYTFQSELKENPDVAVQFLRKDLINSLEHMQNDREITSNETHDFKEKLTYYRNVINAFDYAESLSSLLLGIEKNKKKLALLENKYNTIIGFLKNEFHNINKLEYFKIKSRIESLIPIQKGFFQNSEETLEEKKTAVLFGEEDNAPSSFFSYPLTLVKNARFIMNKGVRFVIENPLQSIAMGLAFQAAAVTAKSVFSLPNDLPTTNKKDLKVALFPYIPDAGIDQYQKFIQKIKTEFHELYPDVNLTIREINDTERFYDVSFIKTLLQNESYDVIEVDMLLIEKLQQEGLVRKWKVPVSNNWHPIATQKCVDRGKVLAIPHWMCANFMFTDNETIAFSNNFSSLMNNFGSKRPNIAMDLAGRFNLPSIYAEIFTHFYPQNLSKINPNNISTQVTLRLKDIAEIACNGTNNPALDGTYHKNPELAISHYMEGKTSALVGYSETLYSLKKYEKEHNILKKIFIRPNPYGLETPTFFIDGLILSPYTSSEDAAIAFADYLTSVRTFKWMMLSEDVDKDRIPRYLLPSNILVFSSIEENIYYDQLSAFLKIGGFPLYSSPDFYTTLNNSFFEEVLLKKLPVSEVCREKNKG